MNIEAEVLSAILHEKSPQNLKKVLALNFSFSKYNSEILNFVRGFYDRYGKIPEYPTVKGEFPHLVLPDASEPFDYWYAKLSEARNKAVLSATLDKISAHASNDDMLAAIRELTVSSERFKGGFNVATAVSLTDSAVIEASAQQYREARDNPVALGIPTGIRALDELTNGLTEDDLMFFIARPRSFKTWMMLRMCLHAAFSGARALFYTKEMRYRGIKRRLDALIAEEFPYNDIRLNRLTDAQIDFVSTRWRDLAAAGGDLVIAEPSYGAKYDLDALSSQIMEHSPTIVFVDGAYLLATSEDWKDQSAVSRGLKDLNARFKIPVVASSQFSRKKTAKGKMDLDAAAYADAYGQDGSIVLGAERKFDSNTHRLTNHLRIETLKMRESDDNNAFGFNVDLTSAARFTEVSITTSDDASADWAADGAQPIPLLSEQELSEIKF